MAKKQTQFLKKVTKSKALEALHDIEARVAEGKIDEAFDLLRNEYKIGPDTSYGTRNRTFLFLLREMYEWAVAKKIDVDNALLFIKKFIDSGANVNHQETFGLTTLHLAAYHCDSGMCRLLLQNGAKTDITSLPGKTPLDEAIEGFLRSFHLGEDECISVLILAGADPERPSEETCYYRSAKDRVICDSMAKNPENPEEDPLWKVFFNALDQVKARQSPCGR